MERRRKIEHRFHALSTAAAVVCVVSGCGSSGSNPPAGNSGKTVALPSTDVTVGFARGALRKVTEVDAFEINRHPITRKQFADCVTAGACMTEHSGACVQAVSEGRSETTADAPADCVSAAGAHAYCKWTGGRLPRVEEWMLAARGATPSRFPWGDSEPTCKQHPWAGAGLAARAGKPRHLIGPDFARCPEAAPNLPVGKHKAGAAESGLEDVLLTAGELLAPAKGAPFAACNDDHDGCVIMGLTAGAIDAVVAVDESASDFGFRCVSGEE